MMKSVVNEVANGLIERDREAHLMVVGLVARQHVLFVGPPGTAKSMMVERLIQAVNAKGFVQLMHKHLPAEELLGPVKLSALKNDQYERVVGGMLPEAEVAFLDEIWKSSPAVLNTLLRILNEREFMNGTSGMMQCPLELCVAASNEWPIGEGFETTGALFDRFLIRSSILPVSKGKRSQLIFGSLTGGANPIVTWAEVKQAQQDAKALQWDAAAMTAYEEIIDQLLMEGIVVGDRRMRAGVSVCAANAFVEGASGVEMEHLEVLKHVLWAVPDQEQKTAEIVSKIANPKGWRITEILTAVDEALSAVTDFDTPEAFANLKKVKDMNDELASMGTQRSIEASRYVSDRMTSLNKKMLGV